MTTQWQSHVYYVQTDGSAARTLADDPTLLDTLTQNYVHWTDDVQFFRIWFLSPVTTDPKETCTQLQAMLPGVQWRYAPFVGPGRFPVNPGQSPVWDPGTLC